MIGAILEAGFTPEQIEWAAAQGSLNLEHVDNYVLVEPAPRSPRTFTELVASLGEATGASLPALYQALGLPEPDPTSSIDTNEEALWEAFFEGWGLAPDEETPLRAARLMADGTRLIALGWPKLLEEQIAGPARDRFLRGDIERYPPDVIDASGVLIRLAPTMMAWLTQRYVEHLVVSGIVDGFEAIMAAHGMVPPPGPVAPPAVVFADLSGYTQLTEEHGDELAVRLATSLQKRAEQIARARAGRLVKLIGDGAMLELSDAKQGVTAALELVMALREDLDLDVHAGVHAGPVIERDRDVFGRTVNLASRIAGVAGPGEVIVSEAVVSLISDPELEFDPIDPASLKGFAEPVPLFRALRRPVTSS
jgi:adenylate cyclase